MYLHASGKGESEDSSAGDGMDIPRAVSRKCDKKAQICSLLQLYNVGGRKFLLSISQFFLGGLR